MDTIKQIRETFALLYEQKSFVPDKTGQMTIEILGAQFLADDKTIFGILNPNYIKRELGWYLSRSLTLCDMEPPIPRIWEEIASKDGGKFVNSNYGFLVFDAGNGSQFENCFLELRNNPYSRRAVIIYTRPSMWKEFNWRGMSDFICTNTVQYFIRENPAEKEIVRLFAKVDMRSNDAWSGYRNDFAWQEFVFNSMFVKLQRHYRNLRRGAIIWNCGSLHLYERNFDLVQHFIDTGNHIPNPQELLVTRKRLISEEVIHEDL
jgi:thymidylate synthase